MPRVACPRCGCATPSACRSSARRRARRSTAAAPAASRSTTSSRSERHPHVAPLPQPAAFAESGARRPTRRLTFEVPGGLADEYRFAQGQHLTLRRSSAARNCAARTRSAPAATTASCASRSSTCRAALLDLGQRNAEAGRRVDVMTPDGRFLTPLAAEHASHYVAFAAGSGITPLLSLIKTTLAREPHRASRWSTATAAGDRDVPRGAGGAEGPLPGPLPPLQRVLARGAGRRALQRPHRCRQGAAVLRHAGPGRRRSTRRSSAARRR